MEPFYSDKPDDAQLARGRSWFAALLSLLPGLGHIYKGHYLLGSGLLLVGLPVVVGAAALLLLATFGLSLTLPLIYVAITAAHAYAIEDRQLHPLHGI